MKRLPWAASPLGIEQLVSFDLRSTNLLLPFGTKGLGLAQNLFVKVVNTRTAIT